MAQESRKPREISAAQLLLRGKDLLPTSWPNWPNWTVALTLHGDACLLSAHCIVVGAQTHLPASTALQAWPPVQTVSTFWS